MKSRCILLVATLAALAYGYQKPYGVVPVTAEWSGWTAENVYISQVVTACFDSLAYCELFTGEGSAAQYQVEVLTYPGGFPIAGGYGFIGDTIPFPGLPDRFSWLIHG